MKERYADAELLYAAGARCPCGAGLAYPLDHADAWELSAWVCSQVLRGEVQVADGQSGGGVFTPVECVDAEGQRHEGLPFGFFEVKSEGQPSSGGATTRPAGSHVETEPHCTCRICGHEYVAARRRNDTHRRSEGLDCPACGAEYLNGDGSLGGRINVRSRTVVVPDDAPSPSPATPPVADQPAETGDIGWLSRNLGERLLGFADASVSLSNEQRADGVADLFVTLAERCFPGGFALGKSAHVDLARSELAPGRSIAVRLWAVPEGCAPCNPTLPSVPDLARDAFEAYGASTGGLTWDKKPIPPFDVVRANTPHVAAAWEAAVTAVLKSAGVLR